MKKFTFLFVFAVLANLFLGSSVFGQITQRTGSPASAANSGTTVTITKPSGLQVGDVMIANIAQNDDDGADGGDLSNATLLGWSVIDGREIGNAGSGNEWYGTLLYRVATASDVSATNFVFTLDADADGGVGTIVAFFNVDVTGGVTETGAAGGPFDLDPGIINGIANDNTLNAAAISTVSANAAVIMFGVVGDNDSFSNWLTTSPGALTQLYDDNTGNGIDNAVGAAWAIKAAAGSTGAGSADLSASDPNGAILIALKALIVDAGPDQLESGTSVTLSGTTNAPSPVYAWTKTSGPAGQTITSPSSAATTVTGLVQGTYVFRLTVNGSLFDELTVRVITGTNLFATSSNGTQISSFTVASGVYTSGPTNIFAPTVSPGSSTAALGRTDNPTLNSGYFYWLPNDGSGGVVNIYGASATGNNQTLLGTLDLNGGSGNSLDYVRLGMGADGTGWLLARENTTNNLYLAKFTPNGVSPVTITIEDASVALVGGTNATFVNGDLCLSSNGSLFALANNGSGVTQIFIGSPAGSSTTLTKKWDLVDASNVPFTGTVNGVAFDVAGALYISTGTGLFYINPATVNGPAGTVQCLLTQAVTGLQDLASNVFPNTTLLPVKLGAFTVSRQGNNAMLNWTTVSEINADHFEIERSYDGINFTNAGIKQASGNSASAINYQFADPITISSGNIYYRLNTLDIDGKSSYSKIVVLRLSGGIVKNVTVYPNPFTNNLKLEINSDKETEITIRISNALGQPVINRNVILQKGVNVVVLSSELQNLKPGMHLMEIISEDGKVTQKIIKR
jgi:hypothetical protein